MRKQKCLKWGVSKFKTARGSLNVLNSADLYNNGRDDLSFFYFKDGANYATVTTKNSITSIGQLFGITLHIKNQLRVY